LGVRFRVYYLMNEIKPLTTKRLKTHPPCFVRESSVFPNNNKGFTWIELIVVMTMMAILSAVVATSMMDDNTDLVAETQVIKAHLRYTQLRSINTDDVWYIKFTATSYSLFKSGDATATLLPGEDNLTNTLPSGLNINYGASDMVSFNTWGKPCTDDAGLTLQAADRTLIVSNASETRNIAITKNTGFIQ
jgi:prepilin-type N-terminal cleavage/methylation domain-containing protein